MNNRTFNKLINSISTRKKLDIAKISSLPDDDKSQLVYHIVRNRGPFLKVLIPAEFDMSWLASMGYLYESKGREFTFIHTCEHSIK